MSGIVEVSYDHISSIERGKWSFVVEFKINEETTVDIESVSLSIEKAWNSFKEELKVRGLWDKVDRWKFAPFSDIPEDWYRTLERIQIGTIDHDSLSGIIDRGL